jgi:hypothetical protein
MTETTVILNRRVEGNSIMQQKIGQGCKTPECQVTRGNKFCRVAPKICGSSVWNLLHVTLLAPTILMWLLYF